MREGWWRDIVQVSSDDAILRPQSVDKTQSPRKVLALLFVSYCGVYFCRANVSVVSATLIENGELGITAGSFGMTISIGTFAYAVGKMVSGAVVGQDPVGRVRVCMVFTGLATLGFAASGSQGVMRATWVLSRAAQSQIWTNFAVIINSTFPASSTGQAVAVLSQSFLVGDAIAKLVLGGVAGFTGWRGVCVAGAG
ncbi:hypothetical protein TrRE_jg11821, partial [Triparma retinervis]